MKRVVEPGSFTLYAGPNSVDLKSVKFNITPAAAAARRARR